MRTKRYMIVSIFLSMAFAIYRYMEILPRGPMDKLVQFFLLIPASVFFALYIAGKTNRDLVQILKSRIVELSSVRFLGLLLIIFLFFSRWIVCVL